MLDAESAAIGRAGLWPAAAGRCQPGVRICSACSLRPSRCARCGLQGDDDGELEMEEEEESDGGSYVTTQVLDW